MTLKQTLLTLYSLVGWCLKCDIEMNFYSFVMPQWPEKN